MPSSFIHLHCFSNFLKHKLTCDTNNETDFYCDFITYTSPGYDLHIYMDFIIKNQSSIKMNC